MSEIRIANRYARSLIELAREKGALEEVHDDMQALHELVRENRQLVLALRNPVLKPDKKKAVLNALFKDAHTLTKTFFDIITRKKRAEVLPEVAAEFHRQYNEIKGIQVAHVTTAVPLDDKLREKIIGLVKKISDKPQIKLIEKVNDQLIGGYILTVGDKQIDDSIKTKMNLLRRELTQNQYIKEF